MTSLLYAYACVAFVVTVVSLFAMMFCVYERFSLRPPTIALVSSVVVSVVSAALAEYMSN